MATSYPGPLKVSAHNGRPWRWRILGIGSAIASIASLCLEWVAGYGSNRYVFPILIGASLLCVLAFKFDSPPRLRDLTRPFPSPNLWLLVTGALFLLYPFSRTLRTFGSLPLLIFVALLDLFIWSTSKRTLELLALPAGLGLLVFAWLWELAGRESIVVLPVDLPAVQNAQFTSEGTSKTLLHAIVTFPPPEPSLVKGVSRAPAREQLPSEFFPEELELNPNPGSGETVLQDAPHILSDTELGGVHLEPVYHTLRHLRHEPTIEAQILIGREGSLTLALRRSDFPAPCFSETLSDKLLALHIKGQGRKAAQELQALVDRDLTDQRKTKKKRSEECNPLWPDRLRKLLGLSEFPTEQDERISNVTVVGLRPEEQLTQLVDRAVLEGMGKIEPEFLGLFYSTNHRSESALRYYREALPYAVQRLTARHARLSDRIRLAHLLIAIANLELLPTADKDTQPEQVARDFNVAKGHYAMAVAVAPEDARTHALEGRFLVTNAVTLLKDSLVKNEDANELYRQAEAQFLEVVRREPSELEAQLGTVTSADLRSDSYRSLAYAKVGEAQILSPSRRAALLEAAEQYLEASVQESYAEYLAEGYRQKSGEECLDFIDKQEYPKKLEKIEKCAAKSLEREPADYAEVLEILGDINLLRDNCEASLIAFDRAEDVALSLKDSERLLRIEGPYGEASKECGNGVWKKRAPLKRLAQEVTGDVALAHYLYDRHRYLDASKKLEDAFGLTRQMPRAVDLNREQMLGLRAALNLSGAAIAHFRGRVLMDRACDARERLGSGERDTLRVKARVAFEAAISLGDNRLEAVRYRARLLAMAPEATAAELARAFADATEAARAVPDEPDRKKVVGLLDLARGQLDDAVSTFEQATRLARHDPEAHYLLGFTLMQEGKIERAQDEWEYARVLDPELWPYLARPLPGCGPRMGLGRDHLTDAGVIRKN